MTMDQHSDSPPADASPRASRTDSRDGDAILGSLAAGAIVGVIVGVVGIFAVAMGVAMVLVPLFNLLGISGLTSGSAQGTATAAAYAVYAAIVGWAGIARLKWYFVSCFMLTLPTPFLLFAAEMVHQH